MLVVWVMFASVIEKFAADRPNIGLVMFASVIEKFAADRPNIGLHLANPIYVLSSISI
jgi:hypothetical protein